MKTNEPRHIGIVFEATKPESVKELRIAIADVMDTIRCALSVLNSATRAPSGNTVSNPSIHVNKGDEL